MYMWSKRVLKYCCAHVGVQNISRPSSVAQKSFLEHSKNEFVYECTCMCWGGGYY